MLLFEVHFHGVLMRVAMKASASVFIQHHDPPLSDVVSIHLMPGISYHSTFLRKSL